MKLQFASAHESAILRAYFLEHLPESERREIEQRYFNDDDFFVAAGACEQELIRDYLLKRLQPADLRSFENKYLASPGLREKVEFNAALMAAARELPQPVRRTGTRLWPFAAAAAVLAGLALGTFQQARIARLEARLGQLTAAPPLLASFALSPSLNRDSAAEPVVLRIPGTTGDVRLTLEIEPGNEAPRYRATLKLLGSADLWSGPSVAITVPAQVFRRGDYLLTLDALAGSAHETFGFRAELD